MALGIYIHIPFCRQKCYYCDFPSYSGKEDMMESYVTALCREMEKNSDTLAQYGDVDTVYIGGGTPTALPVSELIRILGKVYVMFPLKADTELTVEANPGTVDEAYLRALFKAGVNRLSFGIQSFNDNLLKRIGRIHTAEQAVHAVDMANAAGFTNISLDLMYGLPDQDILDLRNSVEKALSLLPEHISIYGLQLEEGTVFARQQELGRLVLPDEDTVEEMYDYMTETLPMSGYGRYEISNFARPGFESRHNLGYWTDVPYIGMGAAAHSYIDGRRWNNSASIGKYIEASMSGADPAENVEFLSRETSMEEFCFLALRMSKGIDKAAFREKFNCSIESVYKSSIERMKDQRQLDETENHIRLTSLGMKFGNVVFREFIF